MSESVDRPGRAKFWRRAFAAVVDYLCVALVCSLAAGLLFAVTDGRVQMTTPGLQASSCQIVKSIPPALEPPPPPDSNYGKQCSTYSLSGRVGSFLAVARIVKSGSVTTTTQRVYPLDRAGVAGRSQDVSWLSYIVLLVYLIALQWRWGRTIGLRILGARIATVEDPVVGGVALKRLAIRYAVLVGGYVPSFAITLWTLWRDLGAAASDAPNLAWVGLSALLAMAWSLSNIVPIVRGRDPIYDRLAGTAILRT